VTVKLVNVTDSRCPLGVLCITAGQAVVSLEVAQAAVRQQLTLAPEGQPSPSTGTALGWEFTVKAVTPFPIFQANGLTPPEAFRVDLTYRQL
jgi:hypothetical protein